MKRSVCVTAAVALTTSAVALASPDREALGPANMPLRVRVPEAVPLDGFPGAVNTNKIFVNFCTNGCMVRPGGTDSTTVPDSSSVPDAASMLTKFSRGATVEAGVVDCVKEVFSRFGVEVVTTDPGAAPHFEIMIAGQPTQMGLPANVGGISPFNCGAEFIPNALVFVFDVWGNNVNEICATAAQELSHAFRLDHVIEPSDPMTYFPFNGRRQFKDAPVQCGSDCVNGRSPFDATCSGPNMQSHPCICTGMQMQNSVALLSTMFGGGCKSDGECPKNTDLCVARRCIPGPNATGGLGATCTDNTSCASGNCQHSSEGDSFCVIPCTPSASECPSDFECLQSGSSGVCWPEGGAGCCDAGGKPGGPMLLATGVLLVALRRRRAR